ncbi:MAG: glycosyltransferase family 2 protein [Planctomycetes bacterium]|nr:glycosyltransferase family 2 protein [Planctomycetota bacterium]MCB9910862.1 glycosyltransferase family 2 protein [Planctomycetota bacterium]MCB9912206.1 glycosyltransferase family 2 protein [Planctomycetota bacterium]
MSIPMVTFRHEAWVAQAIQSVVDQSLEDWEIVLADDASDDRTIAVAQGLAGTCEGPHGPRLRILEHGPKFGPRQNYMRALRACRGEFVAQLDGDDFFVDPDKLSKQVRFLEDNPDCSGVFGAWLETDAEGQNGVLTPGFGLNGVERFSASDFGPYCVTTSVVVMFRNGLFGDFPDWYVQVDVGDWPLHVLNTMHGGDYGYLSDVLSAHRNHGAGVWTQRSEVEKAASAVRTQDLFLQHLPKELTEAMLPKMFGANRYRAQQHMDRKQYAVALPFLDWCADHHLCKGPYRYLRKDRRKARWRAFWASKLGFGV